MKKGIDALTARELQVLQSAARGESARETAKGLGLALDTVKDHRNAARNRLATMLTIAGLVMARVHGQIEHPGVRVVRSALNVVRECADRRATIDEVRIVTIQVACREATAAIKAAPKEAIHYAAIKMHEIAREL